MALSPVSVLARWLRHRPDTEVAIAARRAWDAMPQPTPSALCETLRFVVVDTETSGLDPTRDRLISIGACAVEAGAMRIDASFSALLRQTQLSTEANVLIHGIGHGAQAAGDRPDQVLAQFLAFARRDVLIGYHTLFDVTVLARAVRAALGIRYQPVSLDLALLLAGLEGKGEGWELDRWLAHYGLRAFARHNALADAAVSGELFLIALRKAQARDLHSLADLVRMQKQQIALRRPTPAG